MLISGNEEEKSCTHQSPFLYDFKFLIINFSSTKPDNFDVLFIFLKFKMSFSFLKTMYRLSSL